MDNGEDIEIRFRIDYSVPEKDRSDLVHSLAAADIGAQLGVAGAGPTEAMSLAVTVISTAVTAAQIAYNLAKAVIGWRQRMRQKGIPTKVQIYSRNGQDFINLEVVSDKQVVVFIYNEIGVSEPNDAPSLIGTNSEPE